MLNVLSCACAAGKFSNAMMNRSAERNWVRPLAMSLRNGMHKEVGKGNKEVGNGYEDGS